MMTVSRALPDRKAAPMARPSAQQWMSRPVMALDGSVAAGAAARVAGGSGGRGCQGDAVKGLSGGIFVANAS